MRALIVSIVCFSVLTISWLIFVNYADENIHALTKSIKDDIIVSVSEGDWDAAESQFEELSDKWHKQKKIYNFFYHTSAVNDTDFSIARAKGYIKAEDFSMAIGELHCIKEQLTFLHLNDLITLENIF
ncbi:MAG: DUF4363 family protein [Eubacteriales bacterium]|nr:DUF4363 family protein [Eubacteriales bacterium]